MATQKDRQALIWKLKKLVIDASKQGTVSKAKLLNFLMEKHTLARRTALEYIDTITSGNFAKIEKDNIVLTKDKKIIAEANRILMNAR